jgi:hypothetical protein
MKIFFIFLFALFSLTESYYFYELALNTDFTIDLDKYKDSYIPSYTIHFFKIPLENNEDKIEFQLKVFHGKIVKFTVVACGYDKNPTIDEIIDEGKRCYNDIKYVNITRYGLFDVYKYPIKKFENANYISIHVYNEYSLDYLAVNAYSYKEGLKYPVYDITYMEEFELKDDNGQKLEGDFLFRLKNDQTNFNIIKLTIYSIYEFGDISVHVSGYRDKPITADDFDNYIISSKAEMDSVLDDDYYYYYENIDGAAYICILVSIRVKVDYLSILVRE